MKNIGKNLSLFAKIISIVFMVGAFILARPTNSDGALGIVVIGFAIANVFLPVDISKIIANVKGGNNAGSN